jgi:MoaA/NifB/PqqE/SkfB family radical SAM enzyme
MLGKRCNYDCSYCGPHVHDFVSPFIDLGMAKKFVATISQKLSVKNKKIKWSFTGGEPFLDPGFIDLLTAVRNTNNVEQINVTTNGSLPLSAYQKTQTLLDGLTVSLHLERNNTEIDITMDKIISLSAAGGMYISANIMFLSGQLTRYKSIIDKLKQHRVSFVLRKINWTEFHNDYQPFFNPNDRNKSKQLVPIVDQGALKEQWKFRQNDRQHQDDYYTQEELDFLLSINTQPAWINAGVWRDDGSYQEVNTDLLLSAKETSFKNWSCYAGVDQLYIEFNGNIYRGLCLNDGPIGHIDSDSVDVNSDPTICLQNYCGCNLDIATRKAQDQNSHKLIQ